MDIVDAQVHLGREGCAEPLAQMDALGIAAAVLAEYWAHDDAGRPLPGYVLPGGVWRRASPLSEHAAILHPDRFCFLVQVSRKDPDLASLIALLASTPGARAIRAMPMPEANAFADGAYDELFGLAQDAGLPVFVMLNGKTALLERYLRNFPRLTVIIDHCGVPWHAGDAQSLAEVLRLAAYPNLALKWSHAQDHFGTPDYPYDALFPFLRSAIDAFGAERVMWASDNTIIENHSWAELLFYLRDSSHVLQTEKELILGGTVRRLLDWPKA